MGYTSFGFICQCLLFDYSIFGNHHIAIIAIGKIISACLPSLRHNLNTVLQVDGTEKIEDKYWSARPRARPPGDTKYITFGFAYLQDMIEHSLISIITNDDEPVRIVPSYY